MTLLSSTYFGPVQWYQKLHRADVAWLEHCDNFVKQTYRNRCIIATAQGTQALTVPVEHNGPCPMRDIRISSHGKWRSEHWNALLSAYGDSPFFDFLADDIRPFFEKKWEFLFDFNFEITQTLCQLLDIHPNLCLTTHYERPTLPPAAGDFRDAIRPKHALPDPDFQPRPYYQVHAQVHGFRPNLSILDLLFNMGNESIFYL